MQVVVKEHKPILPIENLRVVLLTGLVQIGLGNMEQAHLKIEEMRTIIETSGGANPSPSYLAMLSWAQARLAVAEKRWEDAFAAYEDFYNTVNRASMRWQQAYILDEWAQARVLRGDPGDLPYAREQVRDAINRLKKSAASVCCQIAGKTEEGVQSLAPYSSLVLEILPYLDAGYKLKAEMTLSRLYMFYDQVLKVPWTDGREIAC